MSQVSHQHGAIFHNGKTTFTLWAPDADTVSVVIEGKTEYALSPLANGWFRAELNCSQGTAYLFKINDSFTVPDPASRLQLDAINGNSLVLDTHYNWQHKWRGRPWHEAVIYEVHVGLCDGYTALKKRLPRLASLGITALELMPLHQFPGTRNWGYDGVLLFAPASAYGTPDELKDLIDTAHSLNIMVFVDVVYNHFGPSGNYLGQYAKKFFRDDIKTPWGAAIDFRRPEVRDFFCQNALMWLQDYQVDGLRFDAVHAISEKDFLVELASKIRIAEPDRHIHLILENEDNQASLLQTGFDAQWNDDWHNVLHHLLTDEHEGYYADFSSSATEKLARSASDGFIYQGELSHRGSPRGEPSAHLPTTAFVAFLQNHDQVGNRAFGERLLNIAHPNAVRVAVVMLLLSPTIPLLFMGEEWGSTQSFLFFTDYVEQELAEQVREGRRAEFASFSHFQNAETRQKIPDPNAQSTFLQSKLDDDILNNTEQQSWWNFYQQLIQLRHQKIIPNLKNARAISAKVLAEKSIYAAWQLDNNKRLQMMINLSDTDVPTTGKLTLTQQDWTKQYLLYSYPASPSHSVPDILPSHSIYVIF